MDVNNSYIVGAPAEPSASSGGIVLSSVEPSQLEFGGDPNLQYPDLLANGIDFNSLINDWVILPIVTGLKVEGNTPNIYGIPSDYPNVDNIEDLDVAQVLGTILSFLLSHNIDLNSFLVDCQFNFEGIFNYLGSNFKGYTTDKGIDILTGADIYAPVYETRQYENSITFSLIILIVLIGLAALIVPYYAQKKISQQYIFKDIKNLNNYIDKVKKEMEKGITAEEIELLKTVSFKKKTFFDEEKGKGKGGSGLK